MYMYIMGVEAGGTKFFVAVGDEKGNIIERTKIDTECPSKTIAEVNRTILKYQKQYNTQALGLAAFGPVDINPKSATYGTVLNTPKTKWIGYNILKGIKEVYNNPIKFDTDVNGGALCEQYWGCGQDLENLIYLTIGTGIGGGVISGNRVVQGAAHTEIGHILVSQNKNDHYEGSCPFHGNCLEGLASGTALKGRWNVSSAAQIEADHHAWDLEAEYLAKAIHSYICIFSPQKIILGGGVMAKHGLLPEIQEKVKSYLNKYMQYPEIEDIKSLIVEASFGDNTGVKGAIAIGLEALKNNKGE